MIEQNKAYEQARDEAAKDYAKELNADNRAKFVAETDFKKGADWHRDYSQKINADLLADCKAMREALESEKKALGWLAFDSVKYANTDASYFAKRQIKTIDETLSQLKGKYDE